MKISALGNNNQIQYSNIIKSKSSLQNKNNVSFSRRLTEKEKKEFNILKKQAKKELGTGLTVANVFDFSIPKKNNDIGIGTSFSDDAQELAIFLKNIGDINAIQLQPQGQISNFVRSPYSGTSFSLGMHLIDTNKLASDDYENILDSKDFSNLKLSADKNNVDYDNVFSEQGQKELLKTAFDNFKKLDKNSKLRKEYEEFKKDNEYWLEKDALYEAAAFANDNKSLDNWKERDKNIFGKEEVDTERISELKEIKDNKGRNIVDLEKFIQFIADKQQKESKKKFNEKGIEVYGDCQIGFSQKDLWAHKRAFYDDLEFGCSIDNGNYSCWSPAFNFEDLNGEAGELLYNKFNLFFKRYDGVRIDAAWQLVKPLLLLPKKNEEGINSYDEKGNKLGYPISNQPYAGDKIFKDIILKAAENNNIKPEKIFLELLGGNSNDALYTIKDLGATLIHITKYAGDRWGRVKYYESQGFENYQNMKKGDYIIGTGTHDDESLISQFNNYRDAKAWHLSQDLGLNNEELKNNRNKWVDASFAELFTTKHQFATLPDILGSDRRINEPGVQKGNWEYRIGDDYENQYYNNLSQGSGLNLADALSKALKAQGKISSLTNKLDYYAQILRIPEENKKVSE